MSSVDSNVAERLVIAETLDSRSERQSRRSEVAHTNSMVAMVSVVVSIRTRKMFAKLRKMFSNARCAERDVREGGLVRTSKRA